MMTGSRPKLSHRAILTGIIAVSALPFLMLMLFPGRLHFVMDSASYLLFQNIAESTGSGTPNEYLTGKRIDG